LSSRFCTWLRRQCCIWLSSGFCIRRICIRLRCRLRALLRSRSRYRLRSCSRSWLGSCSRYRLRTCSRNWLRSCSRYRLRSCRWRRFRIILRRSITRRRHDCHLNSTRRRTWSTSRAIFKEKQVVVCIRYQRRCFGDIVRAHVPVIAGKNVGAIHAQVRVQTAVDIGTGIARLVIDRDCAHTITILNETNDVIECARYVNDARVE
jgi:hypothetical protein